MTKEDMESQTGYLTLSKDTWPEWQSRRWCLYLLSPSERVSTHCTVTGFHFQAVPLTVWSLEIRNYILTKGNNYEVWFKWCQEREKSFYPKENNFVIDLTKLVLWKNKQKNNTTTNKLSKIDPFMLQNFWYFLPVLIFPTNSLLSLPIFYFIVKSFYFPPPSLTPTLLSSFLLFLSLPFFLC